MGQIYLNERVVTTYIIGLRCVNGLSVSQKGMACFNIIDPDVPIYGFSFQFSWQVVT